MDEIIRLMTEQLRDAYQAVDEIGLS